MTALEKTGSRFYFWRTLSVVPPLIYALFIFIYGANYPIADEYERILGFLYDFERSSTAQEKMTLLFASSNGHINVTAKTISLLVYTMLGHIDFRVLMYIGFVAKIVAFFVFLKNVTPLKGELILLSSCFFFAYWNPAHWGLVSIQHGFVLMFALLSFDLLQNTTGTAKLGLAMILAALACFTFGNGTLLFPIGSLILVSKRDFKSLIFWVVAMLGVYFVYYSFYQSPQLLYVRNPARLVIYFTDLLSNPFFSQNSHLAQTSGFILFLFYAYIIYDKSTSLFFRSAVLFLLASILMIAFNRNGMDIRTAYFSRYLLYSTLLLLCLATYILSKKSNAVINYSLLGSAILYFSFSYVFSIPELRKKEIIRHNEAKLLQKDIKAVYQKYNKRIPKRYFIIMQQMIKDSTFRSL